MKQQETFWLKNRFAVTSRPYFETFEKCSVLFKFKEGDPPEAD